MQCRTMSILVLIFGAFALEGISTAQSPVRVGYVSVNVSDTVMQERLAQQAAARANEERQARMKADTAKLLKLAEELQASVDKTNQNILSIDVLKTANEIEKLARSVKEKMKGSN